MAYTTVEGTVTRIFYAGKGAEVTEEFKKRDGSEGKTRWAVWFESEHGLSEGDSVKVSGQHSDQIDEWEKDGEVRRTVKRSLNKATVGKPKSSAPAQDEPWAPSEPATGGDVWTTPGSYSDETPF